LHGEKNPAGGARVPRPVYPTTYAEDARWLEGVTTVSLFDACLQGYFWQYDNNGLKLLQVRFYPIPG
jgi:hypothetical protein